MRPSQSEAQGFVMAALLIVMAVAAVWMAAALPTWKQRSVREKEAELVFRGQQYQRALRLYNQKFPGASPQNLDVLVENKVLRKKYTDPITGEDFLPLYGGTQVGIPAGGGLAQPGIAPSGGTTAIPPQPGARPGGAGTPQGPGQGGALIGVYSRSTAASIIIYNGATHYNEWQFTFSAPSPRQGGPAGGPGGPGGRAGGPAGGTGRGGQQGGAAVGGAGGRASGPGGPGRGGAQGPAGAGRGGTATAPATGRGRGGAS